MSMSHLVKSYKRVWLNDCVQHRTSGANEPNIRGQSYKTFRRLNKCLTLLP